MPPGLPTKNPSEMPKNNASDRAGSRDADRERSRRKLLTVAARLFAARGFHGVSVGEISTAARLSKRMPYYYFGSKEALYREVLAESYQQIERVEFKAVQTGASGVERIEALMRAYFRFLQDHPEFTQLLQWENLNKGRHLPEDFLNKLPFLTRFHQIIAEETARGHFRADLNSSHLFINLIGLCFIYFSNRYSLSRMLGLDLASRAELDRAIRQGLTVFFQGVQVPAARGSP